MQEVNHKIVRRWVALMVLVVAFVTYWLTLEPAPSFWDCPEYIASAVALEPGHPPGNPVHMLATKVVTICAETAEQQAVAANALSGLFSALAVMLTCLVIFRMAAVLPWAKKDYGQWGVTLSGVVGSLALAWSDTFWYSAVETEVYAGSSFFTILLVWLMLKRIDSANHSLRMRYDLLVAYLLGLSFGMHFLTLLIIPALTLIWLFEARRDVSRWAVAATVVISLAIIAALLFGWIPMLIGLMEQAELLCVNTLHWDYNIGAILCISTVIILLVVLALITKRLISKALWCIALYTIGLSPFGVIMIRANAYPPMNQGNPSDVFAFSSYLHRDQYGSAPLLYGRTARSKRLLKEEWIGGKPSYSKYYTEPESYHYRKADGRYEASDTLYAFVYAPEQDMWFPRLWSTNSDDFAGYGDWAGMTDETMREVRVSTVIDTLGNATDKMVNGERVPATGLKPTVLQNITYLFGYQIGYMYFRYLMWNFVGRQNDRPSQGQIDRGNFITGISLIDNAMLQNNSNLPPELGAKNKGRNVYFAIPLILGIFGIIAQAKGGKQGRRSLAVMIAFFVMTGIAIVVYLNQTPGEPRERDYSFVGSFIAYCIWIGIGVMAIIKWLSERPKVALVVAAIVGLSTDALLFAQNIDDHNRSGRFATSDYFRNALASAGPNAIIFAQGDNTLFPLWYASEATDLRPDVRTVSGGYLTTPWHIMQLAQQMRDSEPLLPIETAQKLATSRFSHIKIDVNNPATLDADSLFSSLLSGRIEKLPSPHLRFPGKEGGDSLHVDVSELAGNGLLSRRHLAILMIINQVAKEGWTRPIYWSPEHSDFLAKLPDIPVHREGILSRIGIDDADIVNVNKNLLLDKFVFQTDTNAYLETVGGNYINQMRECFIATADSLMKRGETTATISLLRKMETELPETLWFYESYATNGELFNAAVEAAKIYNAVDSLKPHARQLYEAALERSLQYQRYYGGLSEGRRKVTSTRLRNEAAAYKYLKDNKIE